MAQSIVDNRVPEEAKHNLARYSDIIELSTSGITYDAISGHPDIFFCDTGGSLVAAPNLPVEYHTILRERNISYVAGYNPVGGEYPESARYNAVCCDFLIHRSEITDPAVKEAVSGLERIDVRQGYTRCNLLPLRNGNYITSDRGIFYVLKSLLLNVLYVNPAGILLPGFLHGFFGGACGVFDNTVFIAGSLRHFPDGAAVEEFLDQLGYDIVELYDGPLFDCGSIIFTD